MPPGLPSTYCIFDGGMSIPTSSHLSGPRGYPRGNQKRLNKAQQGNIGLRGRREGKGAKKNGQTGPPRTRIPEAVAPHYYRLTLYARGGWSRRSKQLTREHSKRRVAAAQCFADRVYLLVGLEPSYPVYRLLLSLIDFFNSRGSKPTVHCTELHNKLDNSRE